MIDELLSEFGQKVLLAAVTGEPKVAATLAGEYLDEAKASLRELLLSKKKVVYRKVDGYKYKSEATEAIPIEAIEELFKPGEEAGDE